MFKKLIASALTATLLFSTVGVVAYAEETQAPRRVSSFSELTYYEMDELLDYFINVREYPEDEIELIRQVFALIRDEGLSDEEAMRRVFGLAHHFDPGLVFDNITDKMYFFQFGENYEAIQNLSVDVNQVFTYGTFRMEVLSSVAMANSVQSAIATAPVPVRMVQPNEFEIVDGETVLVGETVRVPATEEDEYDTGREDTHYFEYEVSASPWDTGSFEVWPKTTSVQIFTFFSLRDTSGATDFSTRNSIGMSEPTIRLGGEYGEIGITDWRTTAWPGHAHFLFYDAATGSGIFVATHSARVTEDTETLEVELMLDRILSDNAQINETVELDIANLLDTHEASTFVLASEDIRGGGGGSFRTEEIMGRNFNMWDMNHEVLTRDELNIPLGHDIYLSNIQLRHHTVNNVPRMFLHVQFNEYFGEFRFPQERWTGASLRRTNEGPINEDSVLERLFGSQAFNHLDMMYSVDVSQRDENSFDLINNRRHVEHIYLIEDMETLNYLAIEVFGGYYTNVANVNLGGSFSIPVNIQFVELEGTASASIEGVNFTISNVALTPTRISYSLETIENIEAAAELASRGFFPIDFLQVVIIYEDGREVEVTPGRGGGLSWSTYPESDEVFIIHASSDINAIELEQIEAVRINGTLLRP